MTGKWVDMQGKLDLVGVRESSFNMTRGGGGIKILRRGGSEKIVALGEGAPKICILQN